MQLLYLIYIVPILFFKNNNLPVSEASPLSGIRSPPNDSITLSDSNTAKCPSVNPGAPSPCKCHHSNVCTYPVQKECFLVHCSQVQNDSQISNHVAYLHPSGIPIDLIISSSNLTHLAYEGNEIHPSAIPPKAYSSWTDANIAGLRLYHNNITNISAKAFWHLNHSLLHFSIMERAHSEETRNINYDLVVHNIQWFTKLIDIFISVFRIEELDFNAFRHFPALKSLSIVCNKLDNVVRSNSYEFTPLSIFMLQSDINHFPNYVLWRMPNLKELTFISRNYAIIQKKDISSVSLPMLESLTITYTTVEIVENEAFASLSNLKQLTLHENTIKTLQPRCFANLTKLQFLDLSWNQLTALDSVLFSDLSSLLILKLDKNQIGPLFDPAVFSAFSGSLQSLTLAHNRLQTVPVFVSEKSYMPNLIDLDLSYNEISTTPNIGNDAAYIIPGSMKLKFVDLSHNKLQNVSQTFLRLFWKTLSKVDLSFNQLTTFSFDTFDTFENLTQLDVSENQLTRLNKIVSLFGSAPDLQFLGLKGNPWVCDCDVVSFLDWHSEWRLGLTGSEANRQNGNWEKVRCIFEFIPPSGIENGIPKITTIYNLMSIDETQKTLFCHVNNNAQGNLAVDQEVRAYAQRLRKEEVTEEGGLADVGNLGPVKTLKITSHNLDKQQFHYNVSLGSLIRLVWSILTLLIVILLAFLVFVAYLGYRKWNPFAQNKSSPKVSPYRNGGIGGACKSGNLAWKLPSYLANNESHRFRIFNSHTTVDDKVVIANKMEL